MRREWLLFLDTVPGRIKAPDKQMPRNRMLQDLRTFLPMYSVSQPAKAGGFMPSRPP
jgi:hypothetical protein